MMPVPIFNDKRATLAVSATSMQQVEIDQQDVGLAARASEHFVDVVFGRSHPDRYAPALGHVEARTHFDRGAGTPRAR